MAGGRRSQRRGDLARARFLDAGLEVFAELKLAELLSEIGPRRVARKLGDVSAGAFYHHFPDRDAYLAALVEQGMLAGGEQIAEAAVAHLQGPADGYNVEVLDMIEQVSRHNFEQRMTSGLMAFRLRVCVWACQDDPIARDLLRRRYERVTAQYLAIYENMLGGWGREYRPPFTAASAIAIFHALIDGLALRYSFDPAVSDSQLYGCAVKALTSLVTRADGDDRTLDEVIAGAGPFRPPGEVTTPDPDVRRRLLDSTLARADAGNYGETTLEQIAGDADVPPAAAYAQFSGKPGLAAAAFARFLPLLERPLHTDLETEMSPLEVIRRHLQRLADLTVRHRGLTNALLDAVQSATIRYGSHIGPNDPRAVVPLPQLLHPAVEAGQEQGMIRSDFNSFELAAVVTNLMLLRVMTRPEENAAAAVALVSEVALVGISIRG